MATGSIDSISSVDGMEEDAQRGKYLTFPLDESMYGIEIQHIVEVVIRTSRMNITTVPHMPTYSKGVINLRGKVIPVIDLRSRFHIPEKEYDDRTCFIVVNINGIITALVVDTVSAVMNIPDQDVDASPQLDTSTQSKFIKGMGKTEEILYILLDVEQILFSQKQEISEMLNTSLSSASS